MINKNTKLISILIAIIILPAIFYFIKPEINMENKYVKFSWKKGTGEIKSAIKNKDPKQIFKNIYGDFLSLFENNRIRQNMKREYMNYENYSEKTFNRFIRKWKNFIS